VDEIGLGHHGQSCRGNVPDQALGDNTAMLDPVAGSRTTGLVQSLQIEQQFAKRCTMGGHVAAQCSRGGYAAHRVAHWRQIIFIEQQLDRANRIAFAVWQGVGAHDHQSLGNGTGEQPCLCGTV